MKIHLQAKGVLYAIGAFISKKKNKNLLVVEQNSSFICVKDDRWITQNLSQKCPGHIFKKKQEIIFYLTTLIVLTTVFITLKAKKKEEKSKIKQMHCGNENGAKLSWKYMNIVNKCK